MASPRPPMPPVTSATRFLLSAIASSWTRWSMPLQRKTLALDRQRHAHAATDAQRREPFLRVAPRHLIEQRDQHAAARRADRMTERDGAAVDVDAARIPAHLLVDRASLRRERL